MERGAARWGAFAVGRAQLLAGMNEIIVDVYSMQAALLMPPPTVPTPSAAATDTRHPQAASSQPTDGDDAARATKRAKPSEPAPAATADTASHHSELKLHAARSDSIDSLFDGVFLSTAALPPSAPDAASRQLAVVPYDGARSDAKIELLRTTVKNLLEVRARQAGRLRGSTVRHHCLLCGCRLTKSWLKLKASGLTRRSCLRRPHRCASIWRPLWT